MTDPDSMDQTFWIAGQPVTWAEVTVTDVASTQQLLRHDYERGVRPRCLCRDPGIDMAVRRLATRYVLARMPGSANRHHPACRSHALPWLGPGARVASNPAIQAGRDGRVSIHLDESLIERPSPCATAPATVRTWASSAIAARRQATTLLGLLQTLWEAQGLNVWPPGTDPSPVGGRGWRTIADGIVAWSANAILGREPLIDVLYVPPAFDKDHRATQCDAFREFLTRRLVHDEAGEHQGLLLAELDTLKPTKYGARAELKHLKEFAFWVSSAALERLTQHFGRITAVLTEDNDRDRVIGLFKIGRAQRPDQVHLLSAGLMRVTPAWIPVDSGYESKIARALVSAGRRFAKPIRYEAREDCVHPDFLLLDTADSPLPMEIFGMTGNDAYDARKREKLHEYASRRCAVWVWDPAEQGDQAWPPWPPRDIGSRTA